MPDYEVELTLIDIKNLRPGFGLPGWTTHFTVLITAANMTEAENKAVQHIAEQRYPANIEWLRSDWPELRDGEPWSWWFDPAAYPDASMIPLGSGPAPQFALNCAAELPPGDEPAGWNPLSLADKFGVDDEGILDIREVKHPFTRPNQEVARSKSRIMCWRNGRSEIISPPIGPDGMIRRKLKRLLYRWVRSLIRQGLIDRWSLITG